MTKLHSLGRVVPCCALLMLAQAASAQGPNGVEGGFGTMTMGPINLDPVTGTTGNLGVEYFPPTNTFFVSSRGLNAVPPHLLFQFSATGTLLTTTQQSPVANVTWGGRDMATDGANLFIGDETGTHCYSMATGTPVYTTAATIITANGAQAVTFPIPNPAGIGVTRALAYNPAGNAGNGSFWTANFGSALVEYSTSGATLTSWPFNGVWSLYGLAYDPQSLMLWGNSSPNIGDIVEINPNTGLETGNRFRVGGSNQAQGGIAIANRPGAALAELVALNQGAPDNFSAYRLHLFPTLNGTSELRLETEVNFNGFSSSKKVIQLGDAVGWRYVNGVAQPGVLVANLLTDTGNATTPGLYELFARNNFSTPVQGGFTLTIGDGLGLGGFLAPDLLLGPNFANSGPTYVPWPLAGPPGEMVKFQAVVLESIAPLVYYSTNSVRLKQSPNCGALAEALGANSLNAITSAGFFRVTNASPSGDTISQIIFDFSSSSNGALVSAEFDTDQTGMGSRFDGGNSTNIACTGTYRNGCDIACGLNYGVTANSPCDPIAKLGYIGSLATATAPAGTSFRALTFSFVAGMFTPGLTFEFSCDTDGGNLPAAATGAHHAGLVVTVTFASGCISTAELEADATNPLRAYVRL